MDFTVGCMELNPFESFLSLFSVVLTLVVGFISCWGGVALFSLDTLVFAWLGIGTDGCLNSATMAIADMICGSGPRVIWLSLFRWLSHIGMSGTRLFAMCAADSWECISTRTSDMAFHFPHRSSSLTIPFVISSEPDLYRNIHILPWGKLGVPFIIPTARDETIKFLLRIVF